MGITETLYELSAHIDAEPIIGLINTSFVSENKLQLLIRALGLSRDKRAIDILKVFLRKPQFAFNTIVALGDLTLPEAVPLLVQLLEPKKIKLW